MSLTIKDTQLLKRYNKIWKKIEKLMKIDFNTKTTYGGDDKYIKTRIEKYKDNITTNFYDKKRLKEKIPVKYLSIIVLDSVIYAYEKYYPQMFFKKCKYVEENIKSKNYIDMELESEFDNGIYIDIDNKE